MTNSKEPQFNRLSLTDSPIYDLSVRIIALDNDCSTIFASGTGVVISKNLILTAKHVFEDFCEKWELKTKTEITYIDKFNIGVIFISKDQRQQYHVFEVSNVYKCLYSDLVLFHLNPFDKTGDGREWVNPKLSLKIPSVGERVFGFGFIGSKANIRRDENGQSNIEVSDEPVVTVGEIIEVFPEKRDSFSLSFPCIQINALIKGGMSGGPVFNNSGELIGVVCSSFDLDDISENISYVSLLWPLMSTPIKDKEDEYYPLYDLAKKGIISTSGLEHIILSNTESKYIYKISYKSDLTPR